MLSKLVKGLHCLDCGAASLIVRIADHRLGLVAAMETVCTECDAVLNSTLTSDCIEGSTAGNVPFFVVRQAVAASMDMGVGHAGLVKLCRFLDIRPLTHTSFMKHAHAMRTRLSSRGCSTKLCNGENAECERKSALRSVEQDPENQLCWRRASCLRHLQCRLGVQRWRRSEVMEVPAGGHLLASAEKADHRCLGQAKRQAVAATKEVRQEKRIACTRAAETSDCAAGEF